MRSIADCLKSAQPREEWACRPCAEPDCDQRFLTETALESHRRRKHNGVLAEVEA